MFISAIILTAIVICIHEISTLSYPWSWECRNDVCIKKEIQKGKEDGAVALEACQMYCSKESSIWPIPTGPMKVSHKLVPINPFQIEVKSKKMSSVLIKATELYKQELIDKQLSASDAEDNGNSLSISIHLTNPDIDKLTLETDESYNLVITAGDKGQTEVYITATNFFGSRHALESLEQLIVYDDLRNQLLIPFAANITDKPAYPYRGVLLDTSRNYISVDAIKRIITGMGASKLNTFHWHITDSNSFPYVSKSRPELVKYGAYSPRKVYSSKDVKDIVDFAKIKGVRVMPEFDAPAHVGEGWQKTGYVLCFDAQPWNKYCYGPPCGLFDVTQDGLYDALEDIYGDMVEQFDPDIFHMGGDEVKFVCWNQTKSILDWMVKKGWGEGREDEDFVKLWGDFQYRASERLLKKVGKNIPIILWTSRLTKNQSIAKYLPREQYIIQVWSTRDDPQIKELLDLGYKLILSNYDALYLDCGFSGWTNGGNNWCSPYKSWQKVYENNPRKIAGSRISQILGSEAALWTEQVDSGSVDSRMWPRAAALAETLWSDPETSWREAESRFLIHRERLVRKGIAADALEPEWCRQNDKECPEKIF